MNSFDEAEARILREREEVSCKKNLYQLADFFVPRLTSLHLISTPIIKHYFPILYYFSAIV